MRSMPSSALSVWSARQDRSRWHRRRCRNAIGVQPRQVPVGNRFRQMTRIAPISCGLALPLASRKMLRLGVAPDKPGSVQKFARRVRRARSCAVTRPHAIRPELIVAARTGRRRRCLRRWRLPRCARRRCTACGTERMASCPASSQNRTAQNGRRSTQIGRTTAGDRCVLNSPIVKLPSW
jgi:hypothetical protein